MGQYRKERHKKKDNFLFERRPAGAEKQGPGEDRAEPGEEDFTVALSLLKPSLDAFGKETEETLASLDVPPLTYFAELARDTMAATKRMEVAETFSFVAIALTFLTGVGYALQAGYLQPVALFFGVASLFLPTVILFVSGARREEVNER